MVIAFDIISPFEIFTIPSLNWANTMHICNYSSAILMLSPNMEMTLTNVDISETFYVVCTELKQHRNVMYTQWIKTSMDIFFLLSIKQIESAA